MKRSRNASRMIDGREYLLRGVYDTYTGRAKEVAKYLRSMGVKVRLIKKKNTAGTETQIWSHG